MHHLKNRSRLRSGCSQRLWCIGCADTAAFHCDNLRTQFRLVLLLLKKNTGPTELQVLYERTEELLDSQFGGLFDLWWDQLLCVVGWVR